MLSSTIKTLIGGTALFNIPDGKEGCSVALFDLRIDLPVVLEDLFSGGGVEMLGMATSSLLCAGGVGMGGATGGGADSDALE